MTTEFQHGPFLVNPVERIRLGGAPAIRWAMSYNNETLAETTLSSTSTRSAIIEAFADARAQFERGLRDEHAPDVVYLVDSETNETVVSMHAVGDLGLTPGLIDDRSKYWVRSADRRRSRDVTLSEFAELAAQHPAPANSWITGLLPDDVLTDDTDQWRAPSSWELRHVVGEGSFTGISGAKAAALVGVTPQNFRKYTARDGARGQQRISYAMWHLLLHKLDIKIAGKR